MSSERQVKPPTELRIACLLPSATDICVSLGLSAHIVGVTHECNIDAVFEARRQAPSQRTHDIHILTRNGLTVTSQGDIHRAVSEQVQGNTSADTISSLYPIISSEWEMARPNVVLTQDLCSVCAPSTVDVHRIIHNLAVTEKVTIVSLKPNTLHDVAASFVTVATACGIPESGLKMRDKFLDSLVQLRTAIELARNQEEPKPRGFVLEWLDPPFDAGHWVIQMMDYACLAPALPKQTVKSEQISWEVVADANPDCLFVACCGFDLDSNIRDTLNARQQLSSLRAVSQRRLFACDGHTYFACPGPKLLEGTEILARCAYENQPDVLLSIDNLSKFPNQSIGWSHVDFPEHIVEDMEDIVTADFTILHNRACNAGELTYNDPETGYTVFTEVAHKKRGKCCGSGCRHCPFNHTNVTDKANRIQQPAFLHVGDVFSVQDHKKIKVLFFSGGKDSFLAIRALARQHSNSSFGLVLLTTFDAQSRVIAHQEIHIDVVLRQAQHLGISLLGVPLQRGSQESYVDRIRRGLAVIETFISSTEAKISSLVFGDLHLDHIRHWRENEMSTLDVPLEFPLWKVPYQDLLDDLDRSGVPCVVTATTIEECHGQLIFSREFCEEMKEKGIDGFGENGEFHSAAQVWDVSRERALGFETL